MTIFKKVLLFAGLLFFASCTNIDDDPYADAADIDEEIHNLVALRHYEAAEGLIENALQEGVITEAEAKGQRGCMCQVRQRFKEAEVLLDCALRDESVKRDCYNCYLSFAESMVATKIGLHKWEEALRIAQSVCRETRYSEDYKIYQRSVQMYAYIGSCQTRLRNLEEAATIGDNVYSSCLQLEKEHPKMARETFKACLTMLEAYFFVEKWTECELWARRALDALERTDFYKHEITEYDHWSGYLNAVLSVALSKQGRAEEAACAFANFQNSRFSKGLGGLNAIYYYESTGQWHELEKMIPKVDSIITGYGAMLIPESLSERYRYQFLAYRHTGQTEKALAVADSLFDKLDTAIENERCSKALDLAAVYETREKEEALQHKDRQLTIIWTASVAGVLLMLIVFLVGLMLYRRRAELELKDEHAKLQDAYDQLKTANARAEESTRMKSSFIKQVSHEIRTPLNILSGFTQIMASSDIALDEKTLNEAKHTIHSNAMRITQLVNKMLELSEMSSKVVIERNDKVPAKTIAEQAILDACISQYRSVDFSFHTAPEVSSTCLITNQSSAVRSLSLLLDNACKFLKGPSEDPEGSIILSVTVDQEHHLVNYIVEDSGIGIPEHEAEHIFEEFVQLDDNYTGTGIGLSVARNVVRRIDGDIRLDTTYSNGARFVMTLPL